MIKTTAKHCKSRTFLPCLSVLSAVILLIFSLTVNAAFLSAGYKKGVAVSSEYYFTSNVLNSIGKNGTLSVYPCTSVSGVSSLSIDIRNYNKFMVPNPFDITYKIEFCLGKPAGSQYTYSLKYNDNGTSRQVAVESETWSELPITFTLSKQNLNKDVFEVIFDCGNSIQNFENAAPVYIKAIPISPAIMQSYRIGGAVTLSDNTEAFRVSGSFDDSITDKDNTAGFLYNLSASGVSTSTDIPQVEIVWNADMLQISKFVTGTVTYSEDSQTGVNYGHLIQNINSGDYFSLSFYRTDNWNSTTTLNDLESYVEYTLIE